MAADDVIWARQAIDALLALKNAADAAIASGDTVIDAEVLEKHRRGFRDAAAAGSALNAARRSPPQPAAEQAPCPGQPDGRPR